MRRLVIIPVFFALMMIVASVASAQPVNWTDKIDPATQNTGSVPKYVYVRSAPLNGIEARGGGHYERVLNPDYKGKITNSSIVNQAVVPKFIYVRSAPLNGIEARGGGHYERVLNPDYIGE